MNINVLVRISDMRDITTGGGLGFLDQAEAAKRIARLCLEQCTAAGIPAALTADETGLAATQGTLTLHRVRDEDSSTLEFLMFAWTPKSSNPAMGVLQVDIPVAAASPLADGEEF